MTTTPVAAARESAALSAASSECRALTRRRYKQWVALLPLLLALCAVDTQAQRARRLSAPAATTVTLTTIFGSALVGEYYAANAVVDGTRAVSIPNACAGLGGTLTSASPPQFTAAGDHAPFLSFTNAANHLKASFTLNQPFYVIDILRTNATVASKSYWDGYASAVQLYHVGASGLSITAGSYPTCYAGDMTGWGIYEAYCSGSDSWIARNGGARSVVSATVGTVNPGGIAWGHRSGLAEVHESMALIVINRAPTDTERSAAVALLNQRFAIY